MAKKAQPKPKAASPVTLAAGSMAKPDGRVAALEKQVAALIALAASNGMSLPASLKAPKAEKAPEEAPEVVE